MRISTEERFWSKVMVRESEECWPWIGNLNTHGYGHIKINGDNVIATRFIWKLLFGSMPDGMCVCHHCDNPKCVNPSHLFLGTHSDNKKDSVSKNRHHRPIGESNGSAKLSACQVSAIREDKRVLREIAQDYNCSIGNIGHIKRYRTWNGMDDGYKVVLTNDSV
jgi:hypothetical protein